ncbi:hypothetical protein [Yersinia phage fHe-Yen9-04]|uniref:Uncharacterized protein n=2 Tax=Eneladusvirus Yen904 TaxID=2560849 RepID=A0A2C9CY34_9CAUD|nr:hypothetical protein FDJ41_gp430 [Yersinia phage fHe-Yen9-04]SOK58750.1 hypothetical protein [Yersinia phage fHe-Yen9-04]SOK59285.1 hypothetical protein [Yersinia phage fHe-Yen9-03]VUE36519.1 hypothetical protein [Yersinia phage fHe-Yen9-04]
MYNEENYKKLINSKINEGLIELQLQISRHKNEGFLCLPFNFVIANDVQLVFGSIISILRDEGYTVDITSREDVVYMSSNTVKYTAIITW